MWLTHRNNWNNRTNAKSARKQLSKLQKKWQYLGKIYTLRNFTHIYLSQQSPQIWDLPFTNQISQKEVREPDFYMSWTCSCACADPPNTPRPLHSVLVQCWKNSWFSRAAILTITGQLQWVEKGLLLFLYIDCLNVRSDDAAFINFVQKNCASF